MLFRSPELDVFGNLTGTITGTSVVTGPTLFQPFAPALPEAQIAFRAHYSWCCERPMGNLPSLLHSAYYPLV